MYPSDHRHQKSHSILRREMRVERTSENNTIQEIGSIRQQPGHGWLLHLSSGVSHALLHLSVLASEFLLVRDKNFTARGSRPSQTHTACNHRQDNAQRSE